MRSLLLKRFRVTKFRSVEDSGWLDFDDVMSMIGVNEAGKSNLLLPLWKLNPAKEGAIDLVQDAPRSQYTEIRNMNAKPVFIEAEFGFGGNAKATISEILSLPTEEIICLNVKRDLGGGYKFTVIKRDGDLVEVEADKHDAIVKMLPKFVYYSNYGNLDSEIYLPHVIKDLKRTDLGVKMLAKTRTLRVLFDYVGLKPEEIQQLGQESGGDENQIKLDAGKKKERDILLQSASTKLTHDFKNWWKQGDYRFRFAADGNHFRIWVSDDRRPEEVELESRSTGLQWFLSFFLVFLVESKDNHAGAILLLDEPGLTLHPLAQKDLSEFFDNLAKCNQLLYTTHSPFMIDADKLDRVRAVYVNNDGKTVATTDLKSAAKGTQRDLSMFAAHAALGLTVSDVILQGCTPVIVEGQSDQFYMYGIKSALLRAGKIKPELETTFIPAWGVKGVKAVVSLLTAKSSELPIVILDSDEAGLKLGQSLKNELYKGQEGRVLHVGDLLKMKNAEIEDLAAQTAADEFSKMYRATDADFDQYDLALPIVPQMEAFASENEIELLKGWKVDLARRVKRKLTATSPTPEQVGHWLGIFGAVEQNRPGKSKTASTSSTDLSH